MPTKRVNDSPVGKFATTSAAAVMGDATAFPIDTLKVRLQLHGGSTIECATGLARGGLKDIYRGLSASAFRQATYGGLRLYMMEPICAVLDKATCTTGDRSFLLNFMAGGACGAISSAIMCPADVAKIRMQANVIHYRNPIHAITSIARDEGVAKLWRGVTPTSTRAALVAAAELGAYFTLVDKLAVLFGKNDSWAGGYIQPSTLLSSLVATMTAVVVSFPVDVAKTCMINDGNAGQQRYTGMIHCMAATFRERGLLGMYKGVGPSFARQLVCNAVTFQTYESLKIAFWRVEHYSHPSLAS